MDEVGMGEAGGITADHEVTPVQAEGAPAGASADDGVVPVQPDGAAPAGDGEASTEDAGPAADDPVGVSSSAADPVVTDQAVIDADDMDAPGVTDGPAGR
jgi:hypothetical protein